MFSLSLRPTSASETPRILATFAYGPLDSRGTPRVRFGVAGSTAAEFIESIVPDRARTGNEEIDSRAAATARQPAASAFSLSLSRSSSSASASIASGVVGGPVTQRVYQ